MISFLLCLGLVLIRVNNEYKVVRILRAGSRNGNEVEVHTLGRNCLHWVAKVESHHSKVILSFDLATEEFSIIQPPSDGIMGLMPLMVFRKCLCLIDGDLFSDKEIWVMKDYGIERSWVKEFVLENQIVFGLIRGGHEIIEGRNHKLLLVNYKGTLGYGHPSLVYKKYPQYGLCPPIKLNNGELLRVKVTTGIWVMMSYCWLKT
ncbi:hypothetical protein IFM89_011329 [Coptis chinensis]|uniref:F-box associated domain-containing protein n=1 Tax=Coptis chinensis TaxID=261450 RepID=A0A835IVZ0_9MAGN|nr:hypothetical protein IFM89_011329 [Coptis chinensis]